MLKVALVGLGAIAIVSFINKDYKTSNELYMPIYRELQTSIFGQFEVITKLINVFTDATNSKNSAIMILTGPIGVGKSLTASLIKKQFPWQNNVYSVSCSSLISLPPPHIWTEGDRLYIIEDCNLKNETSILDMSKEVMHLVNFYGAIRVYFMIIFTTKSTDDILTIDRLLASQLRDNYVKIEFKPLERKYIEKCFYISMRAQRFRIRGSEFIKLIDEHMAPIGPLEGNQGCKNIETKLINYRSRLSKDDASTLKPVK